MDCYYAQAECKRLNLDPSKPLCARQWNSLIAINYPARNLGVMRGMLAQEAQKLCNDILLPHVDTFKIIDGQITFSRNEDKFKSHSQYEEKVSLQFYRDESKLIFDVLRKKFKQIEKGGCDEAYIELSEDEIMRLDKYEAKVSGKIMTEVGQSQDVENPTADELLLFRATQWINDVRQEVKDLTQYECSAGISFNKMLAKLASAANKPNGQTLVLFRYIPQCIRSFKIGKIRGFNGKIKHTFQTQNVVTLAQAQDLSSDELKQLFSTDVELANHIYQKIRGFDDEAVKLTQDVKTKSILSLKNIKQIDKEQKQLLDPILDLLVYDMTMRITDFYEDQGFVPSVLNVIYLNKNSGQHQKSEPLFLSLPVLSFKQSIADSAKSIITQLQELLYPVIHIGLCARSFVPIKLNKLEFQYTLQQFSDKNDENSKQQRLEEVNQMVNPEQYFECLECQKSFPKEQKEGHSDMHYAMNIDQQLNPNRKRYKQSQTNQPDQPIKQQSVQKPQLISNKNTKLKIEIQKDTQIKQGNSKSIMSFFQPQKKGGS